MLKKLAKTTLATTSILATAALAFASPSHADYSTSTLLTYDQFITKVGVNSSGTAYQQTGLMQISAEIQVVVDAEVSGRVKSWKTWLKVRTEDEPWVEFKDSATKKSYDRPRPGAVNEVASVAAPHMSLSPQMVTYCNDMAHALRLQGMSDEEVFSQDRTIPVGIESEHSYETSGITGNPLETAPTFDFSSHPKLYLVCKGRPTESVPPPPNHTVGDVQFDRGPFKPSAIDVSLKTHPNDTHQPHSGVTCPVLYVTTRVTANKAGLAGVKRIGQINGGSNTTANVYINTTYQPDGTFAGQQTQKYYLGDGAQAKFYAAVQSGKSNISTPPKSTTINCTGPGTDLSQDMSDYEAKATMALYDAAGSKCPRKGHVGFTFSSNYSEKFNYRLTCDTGIDTSGWLQPTKNGSAWKAQTTVPFDVNKTGGMGCALRHIRNGKTTIVATKAREYECKTPIVGTASDDLAPDTIPVDPLPPRAEQQVVGDFAYIDPAAPSCSRTAKALISLKSNTDDDVNYELLCKHGYHPSGVVETAPHPSGGYIGVLAVPISVDKTFSTRCKLKTKEGKHWKTHTSKGHTFRCRTPIVGTGSDNLVHGTNPPSRTPSTPVILTPAPLNNDKVIVIDPPRTPDNSGPRTPDIPQMTVACKDKERRVGGKCVKIPGVSIHCKPGYHQEGKECVRNPVKGVSTLDSSKSDAIKRRKAREDARARSLKAAEKKRKAAMKAAEKERKAAKKAADAKRKAAKKAAEKKRKAAKKAVDAKRKREKAAANALKVKAAQDAAIAKRKRDKALAKRKLKAQRAKAAADALEVRKAKAQQQAVAAAARRRAALKKRAAPSSSSNATQRRVIRRR
ncbi:MAG: hypothetical protein ACR2PZ_09005 [Pseudomonadales bacterium]